LRVVAIRHILPEDRFKSATKDVRRGISHDTPPLHGPMKLRKELSLLGVFSITVGAMLSSGLFILPGLAHARAGPAALASYLLAGLLATTGMLSQAELASAMPKAGGAYFFVTRSVGPAVGTVYGLITLMALSLKSAFELTGMAIYTRMIVDIDIRLIALALCIIFIGINIVGIKGAGRVQIVLVMTILVALMVYVFRGIPKVSVMHFDPFAPMGTTAILSTAGFVFVSYGGLLKVASLAEEVRDPGRSLPMGMVLSLPVIITCFIMVISVTFGVLDTHGLESSLTPVTDAAGAILGPWGGIVLAFVAILAFISAANAGIMGASRYPLALSRDNLLPGFLGKVNRRFRTPHPSILLTGILITASLFLDLDSIIKAASSVLILTYMFSCLALIILREGRLQNYQPKFLTPFYPWTQVAGIIGFGLLLFEIGREAWAISTSLIVGGLFIYWFYGRIRAEREYALLHLIERITARELTSHLLETELKEIIRERDEIVRDRFDHVIEESMVMDIDEPISSEGFFRRTAEALSNRLSIAPTEIFRLLNEREKETSTVLNPGLAIPHVIIEGEGVFDILLARCRQGIAFSESAPSVHAVFVLMGTRDERNFHLRALAAIAQIVRDPHFEERWMAARNKEALRDVILLGERKR